MLMALQWHFDGTAVVFLRSFAREKRPASGIFVGLNAEPSPVGDGAVDFVSTTDFQNVPRGTFLKLAVVEIPSVIAYRRRFCAKFPDFEITKLQNCFQLMESTPSINFEVPHDY